MKNSQIFLRASQRADTVQWLHEYETAAAKDDRAEIAQKIAKELKVPVQQVLEMWKEPSIQRMLKTFGYSVHSMVSCIHHAGEYLKSGAMSAFETIHESKVGQAIHSGAVKIDQVLDDHPVLKRAAAPAVAGMLVYMSMNGTSTGHIDTDFDMSSTIDAALKGEYQIADLLTSPQGMFGMALFAGAFVGVPSVSYFDSATNIGVGLAYTGAKKIKARIEQQALKDGTDSKASALNKFLDKAGAKLANKKEKIGNWWSSMSKPAQEQYIKEHPNSKMAKQAVNSKILERCTARLKRT